MQPKTDGRRSAYARIQRIMRRHGGLTLQGPPEDFVPGKPHVNLVRDDATGQLFVLKTGNFDHHQIDLMDWAQKIPDPGFRIPRIAHSGDDDGHPYVLMEYVEGESITAWVEDRPQDYFNLTSAIADQYQKLIRRYIRELPEKNDTLVLEGRDHVFSRLWLWGASAVESGVIEAAVLFRLAEEFDAAINQEGSSFFGWCHGNIIGDHVIVKDGVPYLLDLAILSRPGPGQYDRLRSLDWMLLRSPLGEAQLCQAVQMVLRKMSLNDEKTLERLKLLLAFRCVGILGWDLLKHQVAYAQGDLVEKQRFLVGLISRREC